MTSQELNALVGLLQRAPLSPAEALWVNALVVREAQEIETREKRREGDDAATRENAED